MQPAYCFIAERDIPRGCLYPTINQIALLLSTIMVLYQKKVLLLPFSYKLENTQRVYAFSIFFFLFYHFTFVFKIFHFFFRDNGLKGTKIPQYCKTNPLII